MWQRSSCRAMARERVWPALLIAVGFAVGAPTSVAYAASVARMAKLERQMLRLVNSDREAEGLPALAWDSRAAEVARSHSRDMAENGFFAHQSPSTGVVGDRFFAAKITVSALAENLALAQTIEEAEDGLMESPGHRKNLLSSAVTHVGIGIVRDADDNLYITQNFLTPVPWVDLVRAVRTWYSWLNGQRQRAGSPELQWNGALTRIAEQHSKAMAARGEPLPIPQEQVTEQGFKALCGVVFLSLSVDRLSEVEQIHDPQYRYIGIAAERNTLHREGYGWLWLTLILADR